MLYGTSNSNSEQNLKQLIAEAAIIFKLSCNTKASKLFPKNNPIYCQFDKHIFYKHLKDYFKIDIKEMACYNEPEHILNCAS